MLLTPPTIIVIFAAVVTEYWATETGNASVLQEFVFVLKISAVVEMEVNLLSV